MLDWISEAIFAIVTSVPAVFVAEDSPTFTLVRGMFGLLLIVLVVYFIAMWPFRPFFERCMRMVLNLFARKF
jgi:hypothetical protein